MLTLLEQSLMKCYLRHKTFSKEYLLLLLFEYHPAFRVIFGQNNSKCGDTGGIWIAKKQNTHENFTYWFSHALRSMNMLSFLQTFCELFKQITGERSWTTVHSGWHHAIILRLEKQCAFSSATGLVNRWFTLNVITENLV